MLMRLIETFSKTNVYMKLIKLLPFILVVSIIGGLGYFGYSYIHHMEETLVATKQQSELLKTELSEIKEANRAIAEDMKGVKDLTDKFNSQLGLIRSNQNNLTNAVTSQKFKSDVSTNVPAAQDSLNQSFNKLFNNINGATNEK